MQKIFKRVEQKYIVSKYQFDKIIELTKEHIEKDKYYYEVICNIYFDNDSNDLIVKSLDKPEYKEKVRLRSYGTPSLDDNVFLEIKKKYKGIVNKRRIILPLKIIYEYLENGKIYNNQIMREIDYLFKYYKLKPTLFLAYDRYSYKAIDNSEFRITFDSNIRSRKYDLKLELGSEGEILMKNKYIMEVKCLNSIPLWFIRILSNLKIYPISYSKYGEIYKRGVINV